jgi:hypothetical protein
MIYTSSLKVNLNNSFEEIAPKFLLTPLKDTLNFSRILNRDSFSLVFILSSQECKPCSEKIFSKLFSIIDTSSIRNRMVLVTEFATFREYMVFVQLHSKNYSNIYNALSSKILNNGSSFCFLVDHSSRISNIFILEANTIDHFNDYYGCVLKAFKLSK